MHGAEQTRLKDTIWLRRWSRSRVTCASVASMRSCSAFRRLSSESACSRCSLSHKVWSAHAVGQHMCGMIRVYSQHCIVTHCHSNMEGKIAHARHMPKLGTTS